MVLPTCHILVLFLATVLLSGTAVQCATYENVTIILTTRKMPCFANEDAIEPTVPVLIRHDNTLAQYVNSQPLNIIKIENQSIPKLTENSVANLPNVTEVAITSSGVKNIKPGTFRNLPLLEYLYLSGNLVEEIKNGVFANLEYLDSLYLDNNRISVLGDKVFNDLQGLTHLIIDHNRISTWKSDWFSGSPVGSVSMAHNSIEELPKDMFKYFLKFYPGEPISLSYLDLNNNKINRIDPDAFRGLEELLYLDLQNNSIEEIPTALFGAIKYVQTLDLSDNHIAKIDVDKTFANTSLSFVYLKNNGLTCFSVENLNVTEVHKFEVDGNPFSCDCVRKSRQEDKRNLIPWETIKNDC